MLVDGEEQSQGIQDAVLGQQSQKSLLRGAEIAIRDDKEQDRQVPLELRRREDYSHSDERWFQCGLAASSLLGLADASPGTKKFLFPKLIVAQWIRLKTLAMVILITSCFGMLALLLAPDKGTCKLLRIQEPAFVC